MFLARGARRKTLANLCKQNSCNDRLDIGHPTDVGQKSDCGIGVGWYSYGYRLADNIRAPDHGGRSEKNRISLDMTLCHPDAAEYHALSLECH